MDELDPPIGRPPLSTKKFFKLDVLMLSVKSILSWIVNYLVEILELPQHQKPGGFGWRVLCFFLVPNYRALFPSKTLWLL